MKRACAWDCGDSRASPDGETPGGCQQPPGDGEKPQPRPSGELCPPLPAWGSAEDRAGCFFIDFQLCLGPYEVLGTLHRAAGELACACGGQGWILPGLLE